MKSFHIVAAAFLAVCVIIYRFSNIPVMTDFLAVMAAFLAFGAAIYTWSRLRASKEEHTVWLFLGLGLFFWLGGETLWFLLEMMTGETPFPSLADFSWALGYPLLFLALFLEHERLKVDLGVKKLVVFGAVMIIALVVTWVLLYPIAVSELPLVEKFLDLWYPLGDLALLYVILLVTFVYLGGRLGQAWLVISLGLILISIADLAFSYLLWEEIYKSGNPIDLFWLAGDTVIFVGASMYRRAYEEILEVV